ncbi:MAG: hypothetical protein EBU96_11255, partial [Actinobacteria bacterium]|nr:hypothetical protein [Actinomycetota bacterium]
VGVDTFTGGAGPDTFAAGLGANVLNGGAGSDTADLSAYASAITLTLNTSSTATVTVGSTATGSVVNIENIIGTSFADSIVGDSAANNLQGGAGADTLTAGAGADTLTGGAGNDVLILTLGTDTDSSVGTAAQGDSAGTNLVTDFATGDLLRISGTLGNSKTTFSAATDIIIGTALSTATGNDTNDAGDFVTSTVLVESDGTATTFELIVDVKSSATAAAFSTNALAQGAVELYLTAGTGATTITGGANNDFLIGSSTGADSLVGLGGNDTLSGEGGNDTLTGGSGTDVFVFAASGANNGSDTLADYVAGADVLDFSAFAIDGNATSTAPASLSAVLTANPASSTAVAGTIVRLVDISGNQDITTASGLATALAGAGEYANIDMAASSKAIIITSVTNGSDADFIFFATSDGTGAISVVLVGTTAATSDIDNYATAGFGI